MTGELEWNGRPVVFVPLGDGAVTVRVGEDIDPAVNDRVRLFAGAVEAAGLPGIMEAATGYHTATVWYDPVELYRGLDRVEKLLPAAARREFASLQEVVTALLADLWERLDGCAAEESRLLEIPVVYGGEAGPDLAEAAALCGMDAEEYVRIHSGAEYRVYMLGFVPGFPYLGGMPRELAVPRKDTPRVSVPEGSIAVGGGQTGVYPLAVPGGWRLIGRTPVKLFRPEAEEPCLLRAGDRIRFVPVRADGQPT